VKLVDFYRQLFLEAVQAYEPVWEEENVPGGYCWRKFNYPFKEQFRINPFEGTDPTLMYSMVLPEAYLETTIYDEIKRYDSRYELSIVLLNRQIWLNAALRADKLEDSLMGFLNHARGELMNIIDCLVWMPEEANAAMQEQMDN